MNSFVSLRTSLLRKRKRDFVGDDHRIQFKEPKDDRGSYIIKWKAVKKWEKVVLFFNVV